MLKPAPVFHVDVFATRALTGNGLAVFLGTDGWSAALMQRLTQEMNQFESIFLSEVTTRGARARVFTVEEELPFAGHPVLGAAAVLHGTQTPDADAATWALKLASGDVPVSTTKLNGHWLAEMNQGKAVFGDFVAPAELQPVLARLGLTLDDLAGECSAQVVSTGLPYLIVPVRPEALACGHRRSRPRSGARGTGREVRAGARRGWPRGQNLGQPGPSGRRGHGQCRRPGSGLPFQPGPGRSEAAAGTGAGSLCRPPQPHQDPARRLEPAAGERGSLARSAGHAGP